MSGLAPKTIQNVLEKSNPKIWPKVNKISQVVKCRIKTVWQKGWIYLNH